MTFTSRCTDSPGGSPNSSPRPPTRRPSGYARWLDRIEREAAPDWRTFSGEGLRDRIADATNAALEAAKAVGKLPLRPDEERDLARALARLGRAPLENALSVAAKARDAPRTAAADPDEDDSATDDVTDDVTDDASTGPLSPGKLLALLGTDLSASYGQETVYALEALDDVLDRAGAALDRTERALQAELDALESEGGSASLRADLATELDLLHDLLEGLAAAPVA